MTREEVESLQSDAPEGIHYEQTAKGRRIAQAQVNGETLTWAENEVIGNDGEVLHGVWEKDGGVNHTPVPQPTCADRLQDQLRGRLEDFADIDKRASEAEDPDDIYQEAYNYGLSIDEYKVIRYQLSWGGPSDELEYFVDNSQDHFPEVFRIVYHFADWGDHAEKTLEGEEFDTALAFAEIMGLIEQ